MPEKFDALGRHVRAGLPADAVADFESWMAAAYDPGEGDIRGEDQIDLANLGANTPGPGPYGEDDVVAMLATLASLRDEHRGGWDLWGICIRAAFPRHDTLVDRLFADGARQ